MYSLGNFLKQTPTAISAGAGTILTNVALADWSPLTDKQNLCVVGIVFVVLNLAYIAPLVTSNAKLSTLNDAQLDAIDLGKQLAPVTHVTEVNVPPQPVAPLPLPVTEVDPPTDPPARRRSPAKKAPAKRAAARRR